MTFHTHSVRQLSTGSVYKLIACGTVCSLVPLMTIMGLLSTFGWSSVNMNGQALTGVSGLLLSPLLGLLLALLLTALLGSLVALGLWVYSFIRPLQLSYWQSTQAHEMKDSVTNLPSTK